jgi:hypothetical protein
MQVGRNPVDGQIAHRESSGTGHDSGIHWQDVPVRQQVRDRKKNGSASLRDNGAREIFLIEGGEISIPEKICFARQVGMHQLTELPDSYFVEVGGPAGKLNAALARERQILADFVLGRRP